MEGCGRRYRNKRAFKLPNGGLPSRDGTRWAATPSTCLEPAWSWGDEQILCPDIMHASHQTESTLSVSQRRFRASDHTPIVVAWMCHHPRSAPLSQMQEKESSSSSAPLTTVSSKQKQPVKKNTSSSSSSSSSSSAASSSSFMFPPSSSSFSLLSPPLPFSSSSSSSVYSDPSSSTSSATPPSGAAFVDSLSFQPVPPLFECWSTQALEDSDQFCSLLCRSLSHTLSQSLSLCLSLLSLLKETLHDE